MFKKVNKNLIACAAAFIVGFATILTLILTKQFTSLWYVTVLGFILLVGGIGLGVYFVIKENAFSSLDLSKGVGIDPVYETEHKVEYRDTSKDSKASADGTTKGATKTKKVASTTTKLPIINDKTTGDKAKIASNSIAKPKSTTTKKTTK